MNSPVHFYNNKANTTFTTLNSCFLFTIHKEEGKTFSWLLIDLDFEFSSLQLFRLSLEQFFFLFIFHINVQASKVTKQSNHLLFGSSTHYCKLILSLSLSLLSPPLSLSLSALTLVLVSFLLMSMSCQSRSQSKKVQKKNYIYDQSYFIYASALF